MSATLHFTSGEVSALRAVATEGGNGLTTEEIGNVATHHFGHANDAQDSVTGLIRRGLLKRGSINVTVIILTREGRWVLGALGYDE